MLVEVEWKDYLLEDLLIDIQPGFAQRPTADSSKVQHLRTNNISPDGKLNLSELKYVVVGDREIRKYQLIAGDVLFNNTNSDIWVGKTAYIDRNLQALYSNHLTRLRVDRTKVDPKFIAIYLQKLQSDGFFRSIATRWVNQTAINTDALRRLKVSIPPLEYQAKIVQVLTKIDILTALRFRANQLASKLIQSVFLKMFGDVIKNEKNWPLMGFGEIATSRLGKMLDAKKQTGLNKRKYLRNTNVQWGRFDLNQVSEMDFDESDREEFRLKKGDLLVCEGGEVGRSAIWNEELHECYFQKALHRIRVNPSKIHSEYLLHLLWYFSEHNAFDKIVHSSTITHFTGAMLKNMEFPIPPISLQKEFRSVVDNVQKLRQLQKDSDACIQNLGSSSMQKAFNGELKL